jgi:hypothetical protein
MHRFPPMYEDAAFFLKRHTKRYSCGIIVRMGIRQGIVLSEQLIYKFGDSDLHDCSSVSVVEEAAGPCWGRGLCLYHHVKIGADAVFHDCHWGVGGRLITEFQLVPLSKNIRVCVLCRGT